jgi:hypothetical protein
MRKVVVSYPPLVFILRRSKAHLGSMFVLARGIGNQKQSANAFKHALQCRRVVIVSATYDCPLATLGSEFVGVASDQDEV